MEKASHKANVQCAEDIGKAINSYFDGFHKPMSFVKELGFLPLNSRAEFDLMLDWHRKQDFSLPYQTEEMALAKIYLSPIDFREYKELITTQAELGDVRRAATFYKLIRYSYAAGGNSFNGQPVNIAQTYRTIYLGVHQ